MIEIRSISQAYGKQQVLSSVNLVIPDRQITALIGANGAGKSTLVGVISRLLEPSKGDILLDGVDLKKLSSTAIAKRIAVLKQTTTIHVKVTVRELVAFGRFPHSKGRMTAHDEQLINEAIDYMKLREIQDRYIDTLSGGQKQRAYIAMILAQDTDYVFLDEPLNNLDMRYSVEMMTTLQKLVTEFHKTVVVVIHDINMAAAFADYIVAMKGGEIIAEGPTKDIMQKEILDHVFDYDFCIECVNGKNYCFYKPTQTPQPTPSLGGKDPVYE